MRPMAEAKIDLEQLAHNIRMVRENIPSHVKILFAVKRDAYGHGLIELATAAQAEGVEWLGVADLLEAKRVRDAGIKIPILILGLSRKEDIEAAVALDITLSITDLDFAAQLDREAQVQRMKAAVHVIVETGLGRFGIFPAGVVPFFQELERFSHLQVEGIFSHLAVADSADLPDRAYTVEQIAKLNTALARLDAAGILPPLRHIGSAPCLVQHAAATTSGYYNMVRIGAILYGYPEALVEGTWAEEIRPIATVTTTIIDLREIPAGSYIGYGRTYRADSARKIAVLPVGFGSGLHRGLSNCGGVIVNGKQVPIVGRLCLDHTMIDVTGMDVKIDDEVEVIGPRLPADEQAERAGVGMCDVLIPLCKGVQRVYTHGKSQQNDRCLTNDDRPEGAKHGLL